MRLIVLSITALLSIPTQLVFPGPGHIIVSDMYSVMACTIKHTFARATTKKKNVL
jgi:hypothetical protein